MNIIKKIYFTLILFTSGFYLSAQQKITISGSVVDSLSTPVEEVNIKVKNSTRGTVTDHEGRFILKIRPEFPVVLQLSYVGYSPQEYTIKKGDDYSGIRIMLSEERREISEVSIKGAHTNGSLTKIDAQLVNVLPDAGGGNIEGLVKTQLGVASNNELSSQYRVRGGNYDENLVYVNDIEIYRPFLIRSGQQEGLSFVNPEICIQPIKN